MSIRTTLGGVTTALLTTGALLIGTAAFAQKTTQNPQGPRFDPANREAVEQTFENGDYAAWKALMEERNSNMPLLDSVSEENFSEFAQAHLLMQEGNFEEASAIMEELGFPMMGPRQGGRGPKGTPPDNEQFQAAQEAIENGDYAAWKSAMEESGRPAGMLDIITEENFDRFVEMHELMQSNDRDGAQAIAEELGLPKGPAHGFGRGGMRGRGEMSPCREGRGPWGVSEDTDE
ncbi:hypothetical protein COU80_00445 [Candidatus Peregrinibacteria bacterium CG10_big_fil_rev_8_21_14_0_10_55_24]|nr:MAG: hypothetical protein COU80_00445 [Candidatus Peregrinibacteria bacterium CG10_big_fil_rev_8_21_14_0_10_55_24]